MTNIVYMQALNSDEKKQTAKIRRGKNMCRNYFKACMVESIAWPQRYPVVVYKSETKDSGSVSVLEKKKSTYKEPYQK